MKEEILEQDRQFVFEMLDDFATDLDRLVVYKLPAEIGGHAANSRVRVLPLESQPFNLLLSQDLLPHLEDYLLEELSVDWSGTWEDSLLSEIFA